MDDGTYVPLIAYLVSCLGCGLGLICTNQARNAITRASRNRWLTLAAISIGGTGIWGMHFTGMLGVTVYGSPVRWDVALTLVSLLIAVVMVGVGVFVVGCGPSGTPTLLLAGVITGCGIAAMHYTGMAAMRIQGSIGYHIPIVALSVAIAIAAATAALWITKNIRRKSAMAVAIPIMGVAVSGMHYTGMAAAGLMLNARAPIPVGEHQSFFFWPLVIWILACPIAVLIALALAPSPQELLEDRRYQEIAARLQNE
jgi:NO-binding membrane sensor protein with MHYT domain